MTYYISLVKRTKNKPELVRIATVDADKFIVTGDGEWGARAVNFYNTIEHYFSADEDVLISHYPASENWVVERA